MQRATGYLLAALGVGAAVVAAAGIKWYVWDIGIDEAGAADRSMLFWGLPILFLSMAAAGVAIGAFILARRLLRDTKRQPDSADDPSPPRKLPG
jgi:hypothetical protein